MKLAITLFSIEAVPSQYDLLFIPGTASFLLASHIIKKCQGESLTIPSVPLNSSNTVAHPSVHPIVSDQKALRQASTLYHTDHR